jgi:hypothetical protein
MKRTTRNRRRWLTRVALGLAVVAVAAPAAQGMVLENTTGDSSQVTDGLGRPLDPAAVKGVEQQTPTPFVDISKFRIATQIENEPVRPDDRAVRPAPADGVVATQTPDALPTPFGQVFGEVPDATPTPVRPDDRSVRPTLGDGSQAPLDVPAPVGRVHGPISADQPNTTPVSSPSIDWNDAGVGIAIGVLASLVLLAGWMFVNGRKPDHLAGA